MSSAQQGRAAEARIFRYLEGAGLSAYRPPQRPGQPAADIIADGVWLEVKTGRSYLSVIPAALDQVRLAADTGGGDLTAVVSVKPGGHAGDAIAAMRLAEFAELLRAARGG